MKFVEFPFALYDIHKKTYTEFGKVKVNLHSVSYVRDIPGNKGLIQIYFNNGQFVNVYGFLEDLY